jgi:hypothetical protein
MEIFIEARMGSSKGKWLLLSFFNAGKTDCGRRGRPKRGKRHRGGYINNAGKE